MIRTTDVASYLVDKAKLDLMGDDSNLEKAQRDYSKLVKVRRPVTRNGKTFMQDIWVLPGQVKSSDVVLQNHHNVIPSLSSLTKPLAGILDMKYFAALENTDRTKAMDYLKDLGFTWKVNSNPSINWMWAKSALNKFLNANPSFKTNAGSISGLVGGQTQVTSQATNVTTQIAQNKTSSTVNTATMMSSFTPQQQAEINACANGKEKFSKIREILGKDGVVSWAKANGITWNEHAHDAINLMRLGMAVREHFDAVYGTVSPGPVAKTPTKKQLTPAAPKVDPDELPVPANATERTKNLIKHINNMTSVAEITDCTKMGMVPEDDVAKSFILEKFLPSFKLWVGGGAPKSVKDKWAKDIGSSSSIKTYAKTPWDWSERAIDTMKLVGYKKADAESCMSSAFKDFSMGKMISPRQYMSFSGHSISAFVGTYSERPFSIIENLNDAYSDYVTDDYLIPNGGSTMNNAYPTNLGYTGRDPSEYLKRYDTEKEGFVRYLRKVQKSDPSLSATAQEMIDTYDETMKLVGCNPNMLQYVRKHDWEDNPQVTYTSSRFNRRGIDDLHPEDMKKAVEIIDLQYNTVISELQKAGYSQKIIRDTLNNRWGTSDLNAIDVVDGYSSNRIATIDVTASLPDEAKQWDWDASKYAYYRFCKENGLENDSKYGEEAYNWVEQAKQIANLDKATYDRVQNNLKKIYGFQDNNGIIQPIDNKDYDSIWANVILASDTFSMHHRMAINARSNSKSPLNKGGNEYQGNYDYYSGKAMKDDDKKRLKQYGNTVYSTVNEYTVKELSDKIQSQLDDAPVVTSKYIENLRNYYTTQAQSQHPSIDDSIVAKQADQDTMWKADYDKESNETPSKDIAQMIYLQVAKHIPKMAEFANLEQKLNKNFDYVPFDFSVNVQPRFNKPKKTAASTTTKSDLRKAREELLSKAKCSIGTEDDATSLDMRKDFLKRWDYKAGEKTPGGTVMSGRVHSGPNAPHGDQRALFNSRFFAVRNSVFEDRFNKEQERLKGASTDSKTYTPLEVFHGTSYGCAPNIIGREGEFFMGGNYTKAGKMLGNGVYVANKGGKSSVYIGNSSYANRQSYTRSGDADGIMMCLTVMRGENYKSRSAGFYGNSSDSSITSLEQDAGSLNDWEMAVKRNELVFPHHFVDISSRVIGKNVTRDPATSEYKDNVSGNTYDRYGTLKGMK
jgi:hypothetical protein